MDLGSVQPLPSAAWAPVCGALAAVIRQRRQARGLSLNRLAALTRFPRQRLSFIETNRPAPTIVTVAPTAQLQSARGLAHSKTLARVRPDSANFGCRTMRWSGNPATRF